MTEDHPETTTEGASVLTRRRVLRLFALTGAGFFAGGTSSQAFWEAFAGASPETLRKLNIPREWQDRFGPRLLDYVGFLKGIGLRRITVRQIIEPHMHIHGSVRNTLPPRAMWKNIRSTLRVADLLVARLEVPLVEIVSAYRSPAYNATCPGAKSSSYHMRNNALDLRYACPPGKVAAMARAMRTTGLYQGGVGRYGNFTHVDTRGRNADW